MGARARRRRKSSPKTTYRATRAGPTPRRRRRSSKSRVGPNKLRTVRFGRRPKTIALLWWVLPLALLFVLTPVVALAEYRHRVVLLEQPNTDEASTEVLARLRGELTAAGFELVLLPAPEGDPDKVSETTARELSPAAVILVLERPADDTEPRRIELWLSDRLSHRTFVQSLPIDPDDAGRGYRRLAVQSVELLKARLAELMLTKPPEPVKPPPP